MIQINLTFKAFNINNNKNFIIQSLQNQGHDAENKVNQQKYQKNQGQYGTGLYEMKYYLF